MAATPSRPDSFLPPARPQWFWLTLFFCLALYAGEEASYHPLGWQRQVTSPFGYRSNPLSRSAEGQFHRGIDLAAQVGDSVYAWRVGMVLYTGSNKLSGNMINLLHTGGFMSKYHHLEKILVMEGELVDAGQLIALSGQTGQVSGPHLHFSILKHNEHLDPLPFLKEAQNVSGQAPRKPSRPVAASQRGEFSYKEVTIRSLPVEGDIYLDEEYYGKSPLTLKLTYGEHFVEIDAGEGYRRFIGRLWIDERSGGSYEAQLLPAETQ